MIFYLDPLLKAALLARTIFFSDIKFSSSREEISRSRDQIAETSSFLFNQFMTLSGEVFRQQKGRLTQRVTINHQTYFIKQHVGVGLKEVIKNLCSLRLPVLGAKREWKAIFVCERLGILVPKIYAYGQRGYHLTRLQSFILLEELKSTISLEDLTKNWQTIKPPVKFKRQLIRKVAEIARQLHTNGINHRDFYLCHFLMSLPVNISPRLYLIDLHRAQIRTKTPLRWIIKDLAGLYFSSKDINLTKRDLYCFVKSYMEIHSLNTKQNFWQKVIKRAERLYREHYA